MDQKTINSFAVREEEFFAKLQNDFNYQRFLRDGTVNVANYLASPIKVLFLLRETYDLNNNPNHGHQLLGYLQDGGNTKPQTESGVARIVSEIQALKIGQIPEFRVSAATRKEALNQIIWFNLKKEINTTAEKTDWDKLDLEVKTQRDNYRAMFAFYNPDVIICGGVYGTVSKFIYPELPENVDETHVGHLSVNDRIVPVLDLFHPSAPGKQQENFERTNLMMQQFLSDNRK
jgi:hypothetical protein